MIIDIKLDKDFSTQYNKLQDEYGTYIASLNGFDDNQLSYTNFIDNFIDKQTVADSSIDGNSNVRHKDIVTLVREMSKPHSKLLAFNKIYYELRKKYGFFDANKWLRYEWEGKLYLHDANSSSYFSYCFAYDLKDLAEKGLYFIDGHNHSPARHLTSFVDFIKEFISYASNRTSGAVGLSNIIPYMFYFWKKDVDNDYLGIRTSGNEEYYARQNFQRFIYAINQPYVREGMQSAFVNTSVFDRPYFEALFGGSVFPDGSFMIDYEEEIIEFQKWYMEVMSNIRSVNMMTFPVSTISLLVKEGDYPLDTLDRFVDKEFAEWAIRHNMKWSDSNFFIDTTVNSLSNCCFSGSQNVSVKIDGKIITKSFRKLYDENKDDEILVSYKNEWNKGKVIRLDPKPMYYIETRHGDCIITTFDHINVTSRGDVPTNKLTVSDSLAVWKNNDVEYHEISSIERVDNENYSYCFEMEDDAQPYFTLANGVITHNCRLKSNVKDLGYFNSLGSALKVGSVKVSTINLARIALDAKNANTEDPEATYIEMLKDRLDINLKALDCVRHIIKRNVEKGLLPNFSYGLIDFEHIYNTIGVIGNFCTLKYFGYTYQDEFGNTFYSDDAYRFGKKIFDTIHEYKQKFIEKYHCDYMINIEQIPGESAAAKLMRKDRFFYPDANIYNLPLYGNQFIPLGIKTTLSERIKIASKFDSYCNGGSILHANLDAPFDSYEKALYMMNYIASKGVTYFAFNTKIQACKNNHAFYGKVCPVCGEPVNTEYTRIVG